MNIRQFITHACIVFIACPDRFYGDNCSLSCGHCMHFDPCHHISGQCLNGCDPGWSGLHCVTRKLKKEVNNLARKIEKKSTQNNILQMKNKRCIEQ